MYCRKENRSEGKRRWADGGHKSKSAVPDILLVSYFSPKKFHFTLVSHMQNYALDIIENLYLANTILLEKRRQRQEY